MDAAIDVRTWLERFAPPFANLSNVERQAITDFSVLWAYFEGTVLDTSASNVAICKCAKKLQADGVLTLEPFGEAILYFRNRYFQNGQFTPNFADLRFKSIEQQRTAKKFVARSTDDQATNLCGLVFIILRLRNNLFHGVKWANGISGQLDNFKHANMVLMKIMELHRG